MIFLKRLGVEKSDTHLNWVSFCYVVKIVVDPVSFCTWLITMLPTFKYDVIFLNFSDEVRRIIDWILIIFSNITTDKEYELPLKRTVSVIKVKWVNASQIKALIFLIIRGRNHSVAQCLAILIDYHKFRIINWLAAGFTK